MKESKRNSTTLASDLRTVFQRKFGAEPEMIRLCRDHKDPYTYGDKKAVLAISQDEFVGVFDPGAGHYFLSPDQVFRFGRYCELASHNIIAMMLKAIFESFLSDMAGFPFDSKLRIDNIIQDEKLIENYIGDFKPHLGKLYKLFKNDPASDKEAILYETFEFIVQDLVEGRHFLKENESLDGLYPEEEISEMRLLSSLCTDQRETYQKAKDLWLLKSEDLDEMLLFLERKKRLNIAIENKYFETFGMQESEKSNAACQIEEYTLMLKIRMEQPDLDIEEVRLLAQKELRDAESKRSQVRNKIARSQNKIDFMFPEDGRSTASDEFKESYKEACTALLHKLYFMLHTDTCPGYDELSPEKQTEINDLWLMVMKSTSEDMFSYGPTMMLYSMPDYGQLEAIYHKACRILEIDPEDFTIGNRLDFMINKGFSFESIMEFLEEETEKLALHLAHLELVQNEYTNEDQAQHYRSALSDVAAHELQLEKEISSMKSDILELKKKFAETNPKIEM